MLLHVEIYEYNGVACLNVRIKQGEGGLDVYVQVHIKML